MKGYTRGFPHRHPNDYLNTVRLHLVDRLTALILPWAVVAFAFALSIALFLVSGDPRERYSGGVWALPCFLAVIGMTMFTRSMPFALSLGIMRRPYYVGTVAMAVAMSAAWSAVITVGGLAERATGGWWMRAHFFRPRWAPSAAWYQVLLAAFAAMLLFFVVGLWAGLIFKRWGILGLLLAAATVALALMVAGLVVTAHGAWAAIGNFFADIGAAATSGLAIGLAALLALGGYLLVRRAAV